ncbi:MAG: NAD(P)/FAD-dependent oxidoreductase [Bacteroidota bacterium]|nr:NAD(P)/FAD-dependent oxidoreductase [Bacteroidota bacterium]
MPSHAKVGYDDLPHPTVIVVGGGFAGFNLVRGLVGKPYKVMLIDRQNHHCFQPLLYQVATASLGADSIAHPFRRTIGPMPNVAFRMAKVTSVDPANKQVITTHGTFSYDILVLATGTVTNFFGNKMISENAMQLKTIGQALDIRSDFLQEFEAAVHLRDESDQRRFLNFVIVGGGPTGVELAGSLAEIKRTVLKKEYREVESELMQIVLIDSNARVLQNFSAKASERALKYLHELGVQVMLGKRVVNYEDDRLILDDGSEMLTNTVIWAAGVKGAAIDGLEHALDERSNRFRVDGNCRLEGSPEVFVLGDMAQMSDDPAWPKGHPQVATVAIQQGKYMIDLLNAQTRGVTVKPFRYKHKGSMATIGRARAVVDIGDSSFGGVVAWLLWMFVHVIQLVGFRNRMMVLFNWAWKYLSWKNTIRLIIRPYVRHGTPVATRPIITADHGDLYKHQ